MRLSDLDPRWVSPVNCSEPRPIFYTGVSFLCPHCEHTDCPTCGTKRGRRLAVNFWPPIDPDNWLDRITDIPHEHFHRRVSGDTFETLTLSPAIKIEGHLCGEIIDGEIR